MLLKKTIIVKSLESLAEDIDNSYGTQISPFFKKKKDGLKNKIKFILDGLKNKIKIILDGLKNKIKIILGKLNNLKIILGKLKNKIKIILGKLKKIKIKIILGKLKKIKIKIILGKLKKIKIKIILGKLKKNSKVVAAATPPTLPTLSLRPSEEGMEGGQSQSKGEGSAATSLSSKVRKGGTSKKKKNPEQSKLTEDNTISSEEAGKINHSAGATYSKEALATASSSSSANKMPAYQKVSPIEYEKVVSTNS